MVSFNVLSKEVNKVKSKDIFKNLKSDYFLQILFNNLMKKKTLDIIKYNKNIKNRININIKDYKEYSEIYSSIWNRNNPVKVKYGKFMNINEENKMHIHIYIDDNKEEIKRNYLNQNEKVKTIKIFIDYHVLSFGYLFYDCKCIESLKFKKFCRNNINSMVSMFYGCLSLNELNLSNFNTNNVTNMVSMFNGCSSLKELNLTNFNTDNVIYMQGMFYDCSSLKELNLTHFNTNNVTRMQTMFCNCSSLKELKCNIYVGYFQWMFITKKIKSFKF